MSIHINVVNHLLVCSTVNCYHSNWDGCIHVHVPVRRYAAHPCTPRSVPPLGIRVIGNL